MENIISTATTASTWCPASAFVMSTRGVTFAAPVAAQLIAGPRVVVDGTDLSIDPSATVRERNNSTKGHVGFAAYTPGIHAWSPPLC